MSPAAAVVAGYLVLTLPLIPLGGVAPDRLGVLALHMSALALLVLSPSAAAGPARSFAPNPAAYDPRYLFELAIEAGLSAYAAPLGPLEAGAVTYAGEVPLILKLNSANSMAAGSIQDQAVKDKLLENTQATVARGTFGAPTFFVGDEIFFGKDKLADVEEEIEAMKAAA